MRRASPQGMLARTYSAALEGVEGALITVEADVGLGLPCLDIVGRATGAVNEARSRVRNALRHCGQTVPSRRQIVNLAPADRRKDSPGLDLAIAVALLAAHELVPPDALDSTMFWGELALDGALRPAAGTLVVADAARQAGFKRLVVAGAGANEAALIPELEVVAAKSLAQVARDLRGEVRLESHLGDAPGEGADAFALDMADVRGLHLARQAVEVMVAGGHNLLLHGPPGVGKTMLARRAAGLFPPLRLEEALEVTKVHSVARAQAAAKLRTRPPIRMPHHTVTPAGLLGGGSPVRPGEVSMAHRGLLFLDELPEFSRACLEGLREPLEDGEVSIVRANYAVRLPARFQLMAAMNPCPCGYLGHPERTCTDSAAAIGRYQGRVSGPLMDRMDLVVPVHPATPEELAAPPDGESSAEIRARIVEARARMAHRLADSPWTLNAQVPAAGDAVTQWCALEPEAQALLRSVARARALSPRAQHRLRKVARTIEDLSQDAAPRVTSRSMATALALRLLPDPEG